MRNGFLACVICLACGVGFCLAEPEVLPGMSEPAPAPTGVAEPAPEVPAVPKIDDPPMIVHATGNPSCFNCKGAVPCFWVNTEYLLWWIKDGPLPAPLVTTSDPVDVGTLGAPSTRVLLDGPLDYGTFSGMRLSGGCWFGHDQVCGMEGSGFFLERRAAEFRFKSNANGSPLLAIPIFDPVNGPDVFDITPPGFPLPGEAGLFITAPGSFAGGLAISSGTRLWGAECNGLINWVRDQGGYVNFLVGFRYLELAENMNVGTVSTGLPGSGFDGTLFKTSDQFRTTSEFYGGQLGTRAGMTWGQVTLDVVGKIALGSMREVIHRQGLSSIQFSSNPSIPNGVYLGGLLVQPTNIGTFEHDSFTCVPELQLHASWQATHWLKLSVGYDFLYASRVIRVGDQIDRTVNPTQVPVFGGFGLTGPARPAPVFNQSDFWAQGVDFGLEIDF